ncbi:MAG: hypothetical protein L6R35_003093 [Caloplaca aegaea]|nr:MAG: hypothetical protein L6R35_003093 [Caloplaca aegaea]
MTGENPTALSADDRARLKAHFDVDTASHPDRWAKLWDAGNFLPWDRGTPNPAFVDLLDQRKDLIGGCFVEDAGKRRRKRALVPGCGKGYDVLLLASYGYDAYGLEVSEKAVERCIEERTANGHKYPVRHENAGMGQSKFLQGDFFDEFPTYKDPSTGGPPYGLTPQTYVEHLSHPGEEVPYDDSGHVKAGGLSQSSLQGLERLDHWQPKRTHEIGKGTDWISVWQPR